MLLISEGLYKIVKTYELWSQGMSHKDLVTYTFSLLQGCPQRIFWFQIKRNVPHDVNLSPKRQSWCAQRIVPTSNAQETGW
jgi:hypothetical protein